MGSGEDGGMAPWAPTAHTEPPWYVSDQSCKAGVLLAQKPAQGWTTSSSLGLGPVVRSTGSVGS